MLKVMFFGYVRAGWFFETVLESSSKSNKEINCLYYYTLFFRFCILHTSTILVICDDLKRVKFDSWKGSLVQRIAKKTFIAFFIVVGMSAWCIIPGQPLGKTKIEDLIKRNKRNYIPYIKSLAKKWSWYHALGSIAKIGAIRLGGYTESELQYADAAGAFFESPARVEKEARAIGAETYDIDYMCNLVKCYKQQGSNPKRLPQLFHEKNIEYLSLPRNITQSTLKKYPAKLSALVKTGQINAPRYYRNVALNIFLRFLVEKKIPF